MPIERSILELFPGSLILRETPGIRFDIPGSHKCQVGHASRWSLYKARGRPQRARSAILSEEPGGEFQAGGHANFLKDGTQMVFDSLNRNFQAPGDLGV